MSKSKPILSEEVKLPNTGRPDGFFICSASPEERCLGSINKLTPDYKVDKVFLLVYKDHDSDIRATHLAEMRRKLSKVGDVVEFPIDEENPIVCIKRILRDISDALIKNPGLSISLDFSTLIKWHLLLLLKGSKRQGFLHRIRFIYTEPEDYVINLFQPLSFGIRKIFSIPTYSGNYDFSKEALLVLMLGYEGDRALGLYEEIDPNECLLLIPDPPYREEWKGRTETMNKAIINMVGKSKISYIHSRNPNEVCEQLKRLLSKPEYRDFNHIISPLGTKPQVLGLFLYLIKNPPNTNLVYGAPLRHNDPFYSKGIGRTWVIPIIT